MAIRAHARGGDEPAKYPVSGHDSKQTSSEGLDLLCAGCCVYMHLWPGAACKAATARKYSRSIAKATPARRRQGCQKRLGTQRSKSKNDPCMKQEFQSLQRRLRSQTSKEHLDVLGNLFGQRHKQPRGDRITKCPRAHPLTAPPSPAMLLFWLWARTPPVRWKKGH